MHLTRRGPSDFCTPWRGRADVERTYRTFFDAAWNTRNADAFSRLFLENGSLEFVDRRQSLDGRAKIRAHFAEQFPRFAPDIRHVTNVRAIHHLVPDLIAIDGDVEIQRTGTTSAAPAVIRRFVVSAVMMRTVAGWSIRLLRAYQMPDDASGVDAYLRPIATRLDTDRTYITPSDSAGVAISSSPIELVAMCENVSPAPITSISPSSFDR